MRENKFEFILDAHDICTYFGTQKSCMCLIQSTEMFSMQMTLLIVRSTVYMSIVTSTQIWNWSNCIEENIVLWFYNSY